jgi:GT2 family glycosyltransferase
MDAPQPIATIIIVTFRSASHLPRLRAALDALVERRFDLIVVDNASAPEERPQQHDLPHGAHFIQLERNEGFAAANNRAAKIARTPFLVLLNPDAFPEPEWLGALLEAAAANPRAAAIGSTQISATDTTRFDGLGDCYHAFGVPWRGGYGAVRAKTAALPGETFSACAAAALYRADLWRDVGGFDESYFCYCEDVDLGFRLRMAGYICIQAPDAIVHHVGGASSGARSDFAVFHGTRNRTWTFFKNMPAPLLLLFGLPHLGVLTLFLAVSPFRGTGRATWRGAMAAFAGLPKVMAARRSVQKTRRVALRQLLHAMAFSPYDVINRSAVIRPIAPAANASLPDASR